jgi:hypothetical protein
MRDRQREAEALREMWGHRAGRVFLAVLALSILGMFAAIGFGLMERSVLVFGWVTMPLLAGAVFIGIWLIAYLVYFFRYWPYR